jgi:hypothetical protein
MLLSWFAAGGSAQLPQLPPSLQQDQLAACAPATLQAAEECLRHALSAADLAIVQDRIPARRFRPALDHAIERAWRLRDPASPMSNAMRALLGLERADLAAGMIISDLQVRAVNPSGGGMDFPGLAQALKQDPPPPDDPDSPETTAPQETPHAD